MDLGGGEAGAQHSGAKNPHPSGGLGGGVGTAMGAAKNKGWQVPAAKMKGVPLDSGLETPGGEIADPFEEFNSVTLHHDGDEGADAGANGHR